MGEEIILIKKETHGEKQEEEVDSDVERSRIGRDLVREAENQGTDIRRKRVRGTAFRGETQTGRVSGQGHREMEEAAWEKETKKFKGTTEKILREP